MIPTRDRVLLAVAAMRAEKDYTCPTVREVVSRARLASTGVAHFHIAKLMQAGLLISDKGNNRSTRLTEAGEQRVAQLKAKAA